MIAAECVLAVGWEHLTRTERLGDGCVMNELNVLGVVEVCCLGVGLLGSCSSGDGSDGNGSSLKVTGGVGGSGGVSTAGTACDCPLFRSAMSGTWTDDTGTRSGKFSVRGRMTVG
jgi:hypothetical protein